jgi:hypothetical protein
MNELHLLLLSSVHSTQFSLPASKYSFLQTHAPETNSFLSSEQTHSVPLDGTEEPDGQAKQEWLSAS